jgi:hypothetical protein
VCNPPAAAVAAVLRRYYNMPSSDYYQIANKLQAFVDQYLANTVVAAGAAADAQDS